MEKEENSIKLQDLIIYFFSGSIIGWILEVIYAFIILHKFVNRGFLIGPLCPIYGCGAVIMVLIIRWFKTKKIENIFLEAILITIFFTTLEYLTSLILEVIFNLRWWDYADKFLNLNGRICLEFSIAFGILGVIFIKLIYKPSQKLIKKVRMRISNKVIWTSIYVITGIFILDCVVSVIKYLKI